MIYIIKKDGTREEFNAEKIVTAVNKSAARILYKFSEEEKEFICRFATEKAESLGKKEIPIQDMHNIVEGALERVNPAVAKSYRDYRNYKLDFIHMMDDVYTKSQAIRYMNAHLEEEVSLQEVAAEIFCSAPYLSSLFKKETGINFSDYLVNMRIRKAQNLLLTTQLSVSEIAREVGIGNSSYFTRVFSKITGVTPVKYRNREI